MPAAPSPFPLALTPFESLMWHDQRRGWPMTFYLEAEFSGAIEKQALQTAASSALARHPLLRAILERRSGRWQWILPVTRPPAVTCLDGTSSCWENAWEVIDLRREGGVRLLAQAGREQSQLVVVFHHAATDGIGALLFLGDLLLAYHQLLAGPANESPDFDWDEAGLAHRGDSNWGRRPRQAPADQPPATPVPRGVILNNVLEFLTLSPLCLCRAAATSPRPMADLRHSRPMLARSWPRRNFSGSASWRRRAVCS